MKDLNDVFIIGRLTRDPEIRYTSSGSCVMNFSVATNSSKKVGDKYEDEPNFFDIVFWPKTVDYWAKQLYKGTQVFLHCEAKQDRWEKDGVQHSRVRFQCVDFPKVFPKSEHTAAGSEAQSSATAAAPAPTGGAPFEDSIPF